MRPGWCGRAARNCGALVPVSPGFSFSSAVWRPKKCLTCFSHRASLRKKLRCFKSVEQSSLLRHLEASMAYGRCCSKLLLGLCGRFLVRPGIFPGFASKQQLRLRMGAGSVCARACAHLMCRCGCKYVCMHMRMCICMRACMHLHMVQKCTTLISLTPSCGGDPIRA